MNTMVTSRGNSEITENNSALSAAGIPAAGSSSSRIDGFVASANAISTSRCLP
jgi:hypothetical protein